MKNSSFAYYGGRENNKRNQNSSSKKRYIRVEAEAQFLKSQIEKLNGEINQNKVLIKEN